MEVLLWLLLPLPALLPFSSCQTLNLTKLEQFVDELPQVPVVHAYNVKNGHTEATNLTIGMFESKWKFHRDLPASKVFAYGTSASQASVPGPTIEALNGIPVDIRWLNFLPEAHFLPVDSTLKSAMPRHGGVPTVVHLHGGMNEPESDGHSWAWFTRGFRERGSKWTKKTYRYSNGQGPGNMWYHDHAMGLTRVNILAGLSGAYIVRDPVVEKPLKLPSGPEYDRVLLISDRDFNKDGTIFMTNIGNNPRIHPAWQPEYFGSVILVNGKAWPFLRVQRRKYRFRIINTSNARFYELSFNSTSSSRGLRFGQVGSDAFYLEKVVHVSKILLSPSEIHDVVVDFSAAGKEVILQNTANFPYPSGDPADEQTSGRVMKFIVEAPTATAASTAHIMAKKLVHLQRLRTEDAAVSRVITLFEFVNNKTDEPTHLLINALPFNAPVTETPKPGSTEVWEVINLTEDNHPLHVHLSGFQVTTVQKLRNVEKLRECFLKQQSGGHSSSSRSCRIENFYSGRPRGPPRNERGWKNVYKMKPGYATKFLIRFATTEGAEYPFDATAEPGYVYHCHILDHEDNEMMRPLKLVP